VCVCVCVCVFMAILTPSDVMFCVCVFALFLQEEREKLFDNIVQFNAAKLQEGNGSGIGLWSKFIISFAFIP
jgi:hypothetical protein